MTNFKLAVNDVLRTKQCAKKQLYNSDANLKVDLRLIRSKEDYYNLLSEKLKIRFTAPEDCRNMLIEESIYWSTDPWDENWWMPIALIQHEEIICDTGVGLGEACLAQIKYHPRSGLLWCPNCQILFWPSFFEKKSSFVILNRKQ